MTEFRSKWRTFEEMLDLLCRWRSARPFLMVGACHYSQSLVWDMIHNVTELVENSNDAKFVETGQFILRKLYEALEHNPPPRTPPLKSGGFILHPTSARLKLDGLNIRDSYEAFYIRPRRHACEHDSGLTGRPGSHTVPNVGSGRARIP
jgi:hypothetical protein